MTEFPHNGINYKRALINGVKSIISESQINKIRPKLKSEGLCLHNAIETAKLTNSVCVEGFVYVMAANGKNVDDSMIKHCWNYRDEKHFDLTSDYIWINTTIGAKEYIYFIVEMHKHTEYIPVNGGISFISNVDTIVKEINDLLKAERQNSGKSKIL